MKEAFHSRPAASDPSGRESPGAAGADGVLHFKDEPGRIAPASSDNIIPETADRVVIAHLPQLFSGSGTHPYQCVFFGNLKFP